MSISVSIVAQKQLVKSDFEKVALYNGLVDKEYDIPSDLLVEIQSILGVTLFTGEPITVPDNTQIVEIGLMGEGDVMYNDGLIIPISELPLNTIALRVYASS